MSKVIGRCMSEEDKNLNLNLVVRSRWTMKREVVLSRSGPRTEYLRMLTQSTDVHIGLLLRTSRFVTVSYILRPSDDFSPSIWFVLLNPTKEHNSKPSLLSKRVLLIFFKGQGVLEYL